MIHRLESTFPGFRTVNFHPGVNLVLADRTEDSTEHDSRNGLGKTSVVHLIQFCLGGNLPNYLDIPRFQDTVFRLSVDLSGIPVAIERSVGDATHVIIRPDREEPLISDEVFDGIPGGRIRTEELKTLFAKKWFGIGEESEEKYAPSFRSLMNYFGRRRHDAFVTPLKHFHSQAAYSQQILLAFLCGMDWRYPRDQRLLYEEAREVRALKKAADSGVLETVVGSAGELTARKVQLDRRLRQAKAELHDFRVHPQYQRLEIEADELSMRLRRIADEITQSRRLRASYLESFEEAREGMSLSEVERLYAQVKVNVPELIVNRIDDVRRFHSRLTNERLDYLSNEIDRLDESLQVLEETQQAVTDRRASVLGTLAGHGSTEELGELEQRARSIEIELAQVEQQLATRNRIDQGADEIQTKRLSNQERARREFSEAGDLRERIVERFDEFWEHLYGHGGRFIIDLTDSGYSFEWEVEREGSEGVGKMKIFTHDLAVASAWSERGKGPKFLIHDSTIWDGVDERQVAAALDLAVEVSEESHLQYVAMMNTDVLPTSRQEDWQDLVAIRLTDKTDEGRLFGVQF